MTLDACRASRGFLWLAGLEVLAGTRGDPFTSGGDPREQAAWLSPFWCPQAGMLISRLWRRELAKHKCTLLRGFWSCRVLAQRRGSDGGFAGRIVAELGGTAGPTPHPIHWGKRNLKSLCDFLSLLPAVPRWSLQLGTDIGADAPAAANLEASIPLLF